MRSWTGLRRLRVLTCGDSFLRVHSHYWDRQMLSPSLLLPSLTSPSILVLERAAAGVTPSPEAPADGEPESKACATGDDDHQRADEWSLASSSG
uniref:Uncharacterized protein n=1 Tax=Zea mays TaxID=4577 RepID=A0A804R4Q6_MAIZE